MCYLTVSVVRKSGVAPLGGFCSESLTGLWSNCWLGPRSSEACGGLEGLHPRRLAHSNAGEKQPVLRSVHPSRILVTQQPFPQSEWSKSETKVEASMTFMT